MKLIAKLTLLAILISTAFGCATSGTQYETRLRPPKDFDKTYMRYLEEKGNKVLVIAVDPDGTWAYAYDKNRATLKEAAENAAIRCDIARKHQKHQVHNKAKLFAVNDEIVYYNNY